MASTVTNIAPQHEENSTHAFVVVDRNGRFYTEAGNQTWSSDESIAYKFYDDAEARAIAYLESGTAVSK